jgi:hypothetical protein
MPIDPSKVQWDDAPASGGIDASKVQWDAPEASTTPGGAVQALGSGLTSGIADVAGLPVDTARKVVELGKAGAGVAYHETTGKQIPHALEPGADQPDVGSTDWIKGHLRTWLGSDALDTKQNTPTNRVIHSAGEGIPSAVLTPEVAGAAALSGAAGGAGSQIVKEQGGSPLAQSLAGLAAGSAPALGAGAAAASRGIVRGGAEGQTAMQQRIDDAAKAGTSLTAGQAGGSPTVQYAEGTMSKLWGGAPIKKLGEQQTHDMGGRIGQIIGNLSKGESVSPMVAGESITKGIGDARTPGTALGDMHSAEGAAYGKLDDLIHPDTSMSASKTMATLNDVGTQSGVVPVPSQIRGIRKNLIKKVDQNSEPTGFEGVGNPPEPTPTLSYGDLRGLKTELGNSIDWGFAPSDKVANGKLIKLWGSVKDDIDSGAMNHSPEAAEAQTQANALYQRNQATRDDLKPFIDKAGGPEALYQAATNGTKLGATKINTVMGAINPDQQNIVRATVLDRLGKPAGAQDAAYSPSTFLTQWNRLAPESKDALFGHSGTTGSLRDNLDSLAKTSSNINAGTKLRNPSGTGEAIGHVAGIEAAFEGIKNALSGNLHTLAGTVAGVGLNNALSRALTNPKTVAWLAKTTKAPISALPNAIHQLSQMDDPDAQALAAAIQPPVSRASGGRIGKSIDELVGRLVSKWKDAKKATDKTTEPLLKVPDNAIMKALNIAQEHI